MICIRRRENKKNIPRNETRQQNVKENGKKIKRTRKKNKNSNPTLIIIFFMNLWSWKVYGTTLQFYGITSWTLLTHTNIQNDFLLCNLCGKYKCAAFSNVLKFLFFFLKIFKFKFLRVHFVFTQHYFSLIFSILLSTVRVFSRSSYFFSTLISRSYDNHNFIVKC